MTGAVVELMSAEGHYGLHEAYYENNLGSKISRDVQSTEMLDLIFSSRSFDLGGMFSWGNIREEYMKLDTNFASRFDGALGAAKQQLNNTIEDLSSD